MSLTGIGRGSGVHALFNNLISHPSKWKQVKATFGTESTVYIEDYYEQEGSTIRKYYYAGSQRVALRVGPRGQAGTLYYLFADHLGSSNVAYNTDTGQADTMRYYPYGETRTGSLPTDRRFTGQRWDGTIGLYDYKARWYDPGLGRFISADPVVPEPGNPQALNRYAYVLNNPLKYIDDDGHIPVPLIIAGVAFVGATIGIAIHELIAPPEQRLNPLSVEPVKTPRVEQPTSSDMTQWLVDQMRTTAQAPITQAFREHFSSPWPQDQLGALKAWVALVRGEAVWDFKSDIAGAGFSNITLGGRQLNYQAIANIFFGFEGRATGQVGWWLEASAGAYQVVRWVREDPSNIGPVATFFDDPFDNWSIGFGIFLYDLYGQNLDALTPEAFNAALQQYIEQYGAPPPPLNP